MDNEQLKIYKSLSPAKRLEIAERLYFSARALKYAVLKVQFPSLSEKQIDEKLREVFLNAKS